MSASSTEVANSVWEEIESTRSVSDHQLSVLHFLFGKNLQKAAKMVDQRCIKKISGERSGRFVFQVVGESRKKEEYLCFREHYCGCYSFFYDIVNRGELLCCKHQLAARLASSLGTCDEFKVSDDQEDQSQPLLSLSPRYLTLFPTLFSFLSIRYAIH